MCRSALHNSAYNTKTNKHPAASKVGMALLKEVLCSLWWILQNSWVRLRKDDAQPQPSSVIIDFPHIRVQSFSASGRRVVRTGVGRRVMFQGGAPAMNSSRSARKFPPR